MDTQERYKLNVQLAQMLKGGVIMDVTNVEQAKIAEEAGAVAVMALERVPSANPASRARAIVKATAYYEDPIKVIEASINLGEAMTGLEISEIPEGQLLAGRGW